MAVDDFTSNAQAHLWRTMIGCAEMASGSFGAAIPALTHSVAEKPSAFAVFSLLAGALAVQDWGATEQAIDCLQIPSQGHSGAEGLQRLAPRGGELIRFFHPGQALPLALNAAAESAPQHLRSRLMPWFVTWMPR
jgi:hypothetical protein